MKHRLFLLLFTIFSFVNIYTFAQSQQKTAYEKKVTELTIKYFSICYYGYNRSLSWAEKAELEMYTNGDEARGFILGLGILNYAMNHSEAETKKLMNQIKNEYSAAEKLKTSVDIQREKEAKLKKEKLEKEKKLKETQAAYLRTDKGSIYNNVKTEFSKWNQKGEFEKEADFVERIKNKSKDEFNKVCIEQIKNKIKTLGSSYYVYNLKKELSTYDSEGEFFTVLFTFNGVEWKNVLNIPISEAEEFKKNWEYLELNLNENNWCFVENSLCPTKIALVYNGRNEDYYSDDKPNVNKKEYPFPLIQKNQSEISIVFDDLEITNEYLKGFVFKFSEVKMIEEDLLREAKRLDSLELLSYNEKLDSVFNFYIKKLLNNPYNTTKEKMTEYNKVENSEENRVESYNNSIELIQSKYERMNNNFERELKSQNPSEYCVIYYSLNPEKKVDADKKYIECRCIYSQRVNFDMKFIEGNLYNCNCREKEYQKNGGLFISKAEFDSFYNKGEDVHQKEVETRILKKEEENAINEIVSNAPKIDRIDFKDVKLNLSNNDLASSYYQKVYSYKVKPYYQKVIEVLIENNKGLKKEWTKKGEKFNSKVEFYEAFTSGEYKKILKEKNR